MATAKSKFTKAAKPKKAKKRGSSSRKGWTYSDIQQARAQGESSKAD